ncbi:MAG: M28 family peptidase [Flavisolibacter sp.]
MRIFLLFVIGCCVSFQLRSQQIDESFVHQAMHYLASDSLKGRGNYTPELQQAARYIAGSFLEDSLWFFPGDSSYLQPFTTKELGNDSLVKDSSGLFDATKVLYNVIGFLPADTPTAETVIFSAHYDHIGAAGKNSFYNGANDDASGTVAVLALAKYYALQKGRKRNLMFCAFAGEELGLKGSKVFAKKINADVMVANINIEMIGVATYTKKGSFYITGESRSDLGRIVRKRLKPLKFKVAREPNYTKQLYYRSDNYSFAELGIPAHSFMSSDDDDPCYHADCDEVQRIDFPHMISVIENIARGVHGLVFGLEKPKQ